MSQKSGTQKASAEAVIKDIRRATRKQYGAEEKIRIVLEVCAARSRSPRCADVKGSPRAFTTTGRRNSSKPARSGWLVIQRGLPPAMTLSSCAARPAI